MSPRAYCKQCGYPVSTCLCDAVRKQRSPVPIIIIQHPEEARHAKNTARLVKLAIDDAQILVAEQHIEYKLQSLLGKDASPALFFPRPDSLSLEHNCDAFRSSQPSHLLFIDATWRKARKIWHLNPFLHQLAVWHLSPSSPSSYRIRKPPSSSSMSTLEAICNVLASVYQEDVASLEHLFEVMQSRTQQRPTEQPLQGQ